MNMRLGFLLGVVLASGTVWAGSASQYNMSLQRKVVTGPKGSLTSPVAASVNKKGQMDEKRVQKIADGVYRLAGWGIANLIAVEAPEGWIIVDAGDYLEGPGAAPRPGRQGRQDQGRGRALHPFPLCDRGEGLAG